MCAAALTARAGLATLHELTASFAPERAHGSKIEVAPMTAFRSFQVFSYVVLGLMGAGIAYAGAISVIYWTGISV